MWKEIKFPADKEVITMKTESALAFDNKTCGEFCHIVGVSDRNKIIEFFLEGRELDFAPSYIASELDISKTTLYSLMSELVSDKILAKSRMVGNTQLYKLNTSSDRVKSLIAFFNQIMSGIEIDN